jgi:hypothetical protein
MHSCATCSQPSATVAAEPPTACLPLLIFEVGGDHLLVPSGPETKYPLTQNLDPELFCSSAVLQKDPMTSWPYPRSCRTGSICSGRAGTSAGRPCQCVLPFMPALCAQISSLDDALGTDAR